MKLAKKNKLNGMDLSPADQSTIEIVDGSKIVKEGSFFKRGNRIQTWHRRFFILYDNGALVYYAKESAADQSKFKKGSINLKNLESVDDSDVIFERRFSKQRVTVG